MYKVLFLSAYHKQRIYVRSTCKKIEFRKKEKKLLKYKKKPAEIMVQASDKILVIIEIEHYVFVISRSRS